MQASSERHGLQLWCLDDFIRLKMKETPPSTENKSSWERRTSEEYQGAEIYRGEWLEKEKQRLLFFVFIHYVAENKPQTVKRSQKRSRCTDLLTLSLHFTAPLHTILHSLKAIAVSWQTACTLSWNDTACDSGLPIVGRTWHGWKIDPICSRTWVYRPQRAFRRGKKEQRGFKCEEPHRQQDEKVNGVSELNNCHSPHPQFSSSQFRI